MSREPKAPFVDEELERDALREIIYWSTIGGYDVVGDLDIASEKELFSDVRAMAWSGLLYGYEQNGKVDHGYVLNAIPAGELRTEATAWALAPSHYGSREFVPWSTYLDRLRTLAACRQVLNAQTYLCELKDSPTAVRQVAYKMCCALEGVVVGGVKQEAVGEDFDRYREIMRKGGTWITGLEQLDHIGRFGGYYGIVAARSHHGKTAVIVSMLLNQLMKGFSVLLWQGEQTKAQMYLRFICQMTGLRSWEVLKPQSAENELLIAKARKSIDAWLAQEQDKPSLYLYDGRKSVFDVLRLIRAARQKHAISVAYIDQLSKFSRNQSLPRESAYSDISEVLAVESLKLKQPILVAHQLNIKERKDAAGPPAFWQVKDCGRLYEDCDIWITVDRPEVDAERMIEFDKARDKAKAKGDIETADRFDVRGRVKIKVEKDRVATFGCHEEWLGFDHECGKIYSRIRGPDELEHAVRATQAELSGLAAESAIADEEAF